MTWRRAWHTVAPALVGAGFASAAAGRTLGFVGEHAARGELWAIGQLALIYFESLAAWYVAKRAIGDAP